MTDANLNDLDPTLKQIAEQFLILCNAKFITKINVTYRNSDDQDKAHAAGLSNALAGQSPHNVCTPSGSPCSRAFDFAIFNADNSYVTDGTDERYAQAAEIGKGLELNWGGDWHHPDYDHLEMKNWRIV